jgi:hypothetical protein
MRGYICYTQRQCYVIIRGSESGQTATETPRHGSVYCCEVQVCARLRLFCSVLSSLRSTIKTNWALIQTLGFLNPSNLSLTATRCLDRGYWGVPAAPPLPFLGINDSFWHRRFRKVEITVQVFLKSQSSLEKPLEDARVEARRLVGGDVETLLGDTKPDPYVFDAEAWVRTVVVQRKV